MITAIEYEEKPGDPLLTVSEFAKRKGVNKSSVSRMVKRHGIRLNQDRKAPLSVWLEADKRGMAMNKDVETSGPLADRLAQEKMKLLAVERQRKELKLAEEQGRVILIDEHKRRLASICGWCVRLLDRCLQNFAMTCRDPLLFQRLQDDVERAKRETCEEAERLSAQAFPTNPPQSAAAESAENDGEKDA